MTATLIAGVDRRTDLRRAAVAARRRRPGRLAVAVPARRHSGGRPRHRRLALADRAARGRVVADRRRSARRWSRRLADDSAASATRDDARVRCASGRTWLLAVVYFTIPGDALRHRLLAAADVEDRVRRPAISRVGLLERDSVCRRARSRWSIVGRHSDRTGERRWHVFVRGAGQRRGRCAEHVGVDGIAWTDRRRCRSRCSAWRRCSVRSGRSPLRSLRGVGAAAAIALINSVGNTGGFVGPYLLGAINDATHSFALGLSRLRRCWRSARRWCLALTEGTDT